VRRAALLGLVLLLALVALPPLVAPGPNPAILPPRGRPVGVGGAEVNVVEIGEGSPIVLVHGLPSSVSDWATLPGALAARGHRVIVYDRVGFGHASRPDPSPGRYTLESNARELGALMDALGVPRAALVGWSYGGGIVQVFAREHPERVSHLVLLASVGPVEAVEPTILDRMVELPFATPIFEWVTSIPPLGEAMTRDAVAAAFSGASAVPPGWVERTRAMMSLPNTLRSMVLEMQRYDAGVLRPEELGVPALVLHGTDDRNVAFATGEDLARRIPGARLEAIDAGSHMLPATHPDALAESIHRFVAGGAGG
jgi:pimeloyl-ACP methyl ester carboxylesterase